LSFLFSAAGTPNLIVVGWASWPRSWLLIVILMKPERASPLRRNYGQKLFRYFFIGIICEAMSSSISCRIAVDMRASRKLLYGPVKGRCRESKAAKQLSAFFFAILMNHKP
jgi:hypothetical protein